MNNAFYGWLEIRVVCLPLLLDYWNYCDDIRLEDSLPFKGHRLITPKALQKYSLETIQEGHYQVVNSLKIERTVFCSRITEDITKVVQSCNTCQVY